jgi:hypothetical protein
MHVVFDDSSRPSLVWADLDEEALGRLDMLADDPAARVVLLNEMMGVKHYSDNPRSAILADFCLYNLVFCDEAGFSLAKKSAFFSIMKCVFEHAFQGGSAEVGVGASGDALDSGALSEGCEAVSSEDSMAYFQKQILAHSVDSPSERMVAVFDLPDVQALTDFVGKTFYRNYSAYRLCFSTKQAVELATRQVSIETPLAPPPLCEFELVGSSPAAR